MEFQKYNVKKKKKKRRRRRRRKIKRENKQTNFWSLLCSPEKAMAPHSSTFAWKIAWTEEPGRLQSMGLLESDTTERLI